jgi:DNA polymerase-3 subunit delta
MQLRPERLSAHLEKPLSALYLIHGDEPLLVLEAADAVRSAARKQGFDEREILVAGQGFRWDDLFLAAGNMSLFGSSKLIDLRIPNGKPGRDGGDALQRYCEQLGQGTVTLVSLPLLDWQARKAAWFAALADAGTVIECDAPPLPQLPAWIATRLQMQRQNAPQDALQFIANHVEGNLLAAHQEIRKLGLLYPEGQLTLAQVEEAVLDVARFDVDKLRQALLAGDVTRCARLLEGLRAEDTAAPLILWALATEARTLAQLRSDVDRGLSLDAAFNTRKVFRQRQDFYRPAIKRVSAAAARMALLHAARIDRMIKGLAQGDVWDEFLQMSLRLASNR